MPEGTSWLLHPGSESPTHVSDLTWAPLPLTETSVRPLLIPIQMMTKPALAALVSCAGLSAVNSDKASLQLLDSE